MSYDIKPIISKRDIVTNTFNINTGNAMYVAKVIVRRNDNRKDDIYEFIDIIDVYTLNNVFTGVSFDYDENIKFNDSAIGKIIFPKDDKDSVLFTLFKSDKVPEQITIDTDIRESKPNTTKLLYSVGFIFNYLLKHDIININQQR